MTIRILLIDDHTLFRSGGRALLQRQPDFEVVDELTCALREGACGYLLKNMKADALATMIRRAAEGESVIAESMMQQLIAQMRTPVRAEAIPAPPAIRTTRRTCVDTARTRHCADPVARREQQGHRA